MGRVLTVDSLEPIGIQGDFLTGASDQRWVNPLPAECSLHFGGRWMYLIRPKAGKGLIWISMYHTFSLEAHWDPLYVTMYFSCIFQCTILFPLKRTENHPHILIFVDLWKKCGKAACWLEVFVHLLEEWPRCVTMNVCLLCQTLTFQLKLYGSILFIYLQQ